MIDATRRHGAQLVEAWSDRYREGTLPHADNHSAHFGVHPTQPVSSTLAFTVEAWVRNLGWGMAVSRERGRSAPSS